jgi:hypothetical protein
MKKFTLFFCLLLSFSAQSQTYFSKLFGRPNPYVESIINATEVPGAGFICPITSFDYLQDTNKIYLVRIDQSGNTVWTKSYGKENTAHELYEIIQTRDSCYIFTGLEWQGDTVSTILFKVNINGDSLWLQRFNDAALYCPSFNITQTSDSGFFVSGFSESIDASTQQSLSRQAYAVKTDSLGQEEWHLNYGSPSFDEVCSDAIQTLDGGYLLVGRKVNPYFFDFSAEGLILKLSPQGTVQWTKNWSDTEHDQGFTTIIQTLDENYLLSGGWSFKDELFPDDPYGGGGVLIKMSPSGTFLWERKYGDDVGDAEFQDVAQLPDGTIVTAGYRHVPKESPSLVKFNADGDIIWWRNYDYNPTQSEAIFDLVPTSDKGFLLTGYALPTGVIGNNASDGWLLKVDSMGCEIPLCVTGTDEPETSLAGSDLSLYPNPAGQSVTVGWSATGFEGLLEIWTIGGLCVQRIKITAAETFKALDISTLAKGVYFVRLNTERGSAVRKLVIEH